MTVPINERHRAKVANHDERFGALWQAIQILVIVGEEQEKRIKALEAKNKPTTKKKGK